MLVDLIDLSLLGKQAQWSLENHAASRLSHRMRKLVGSWRALADMVAQRAVAIGVVPDGQAETIAETTELQPLPVTAASDGQLEDAIAGQIADAAARGRRRSHCAAVRDPVSADLLAEVVATLDDQAWKIRVSR
jgi:starvation-inducible DNA-binding protein